MINSRKIRWGILGTMWISDRIAEAIKESDNSEMIAICSRDLSRATTFSQKYRIPNIYVDSHKFLANPEIDAVYIGLPNHLHKEWIIHCAKAGKHILCEKPFVLDPKEAHEALAAVKKHQVFCMEALMYRCHPFISQLENLLNSKVIGDIQFINAIYTVDIAQSANKIAGGAIRNLGCYPISLIRLLAREEPINIVAQGKLAAEIKNDQLSTAILSFKNGIIATVTIADNHPMYTHFSIFGTKGMLEIKTNPWLPSKNNEILIKTADKIETCNFSAEKFLYTYQIELMANQIKQGLKTPQNPGVTSLHSLENVVVLDHWLTQIKSSHEPTETTKLIHNIPEVRLFSH